MDYTIVVPSRKRAHNMATIRSLLPSAIICVDEREAAEYGAVVPASNLLLHPPMDGLWNVINWMMDAIKTETLIEIDDDFRGVQVTMGSMRYLTDPEEILAVLENAMTCCADLGLSTFCFSRTPNTSVIRPDSRPIVPTQSVCNAFGVMGAARHRKYDSQFAGRADVDWALRTLLDDRLVYADIRFYFDCGMVFSGRGGNVGLIDTEIFENSSRKLKEKWGKNVSFKAPGYVKNRQVAPIRIAVSRTNNRAQK